MKMAYSGNSGRALSTVVSPKEYCHSWKKPAMKETRRTDRQESRATIRRDLENEQKRARLVAAIQRDRKEWERLFELLNDM